MAKENPRMLLQICCAPCSPHVVTLLREQFVVAGYFYNPNIQPEEEFALRRAAVEQYARHAGLPLIQPPYRPAEWLERIAGLEDEPEGGARCTVCFRMRLEKTAAYAKAHGYDWFATTLTISPHKSAATINNLGTEVAREHGIRFYTADFKKKNGFARSVKLSKELRLYRQSYCGCLFSKRAKEQLPSHLEGDV